LSTASDLDSAAILEIFPHHQVLYSGIAKMH